MNETQPKAEQGDSGVLIHGKPAIGSGTREDPYRPSPEQRLFDRRTTWLERRDRERDLRDDAIRKEHREWAQAEMDRTFNVQAEILAELQAIRRVLEQE